MLNNLELSILYYDDNFLWLLLLLLFYFLGKFGYNQFA